MRWWYLILFIVFILSDEERTCMEALIDAGVPLTFLPQHDEKAVAVYTDTVQLNVAGRGKVNLNIEEDGPYTYFTTDMDTLVGEDWSREMYEPIRRCNENDTFGSTLIYDNTNISSVFNSRTSNVNTQWLMFVEDTSLMYLGPAIVQRAQLDSDKCEERIVQALEGWNHTYMVYDSTESGWYMVFQCSVIDQGDFSELDLSLPGFFGVPNYYGGTYVYGMDLIYFKLYKDRVINCFDINAFFHQGNIEHIGDSLIKVHATSTVKLVSDHKIHVIHHIGVYSASWEESQPESEFNLEDVSYDLVDTGDHIFHPEKEIPGFEKMCDGETCDSTYFFPELYAYKKLDVLKRKGNKRQKKLLADFEYDSTAYFR